MYCPKSESRQWQILFDPACSVLRSMVLLSDWRYFLLARRIRCNIRKENSQPANSERCFRYFHAFDALFSLLKISSGMKNSKKPGSAFPILSSSEVSEDRLRLEPRKAWMGCQEIWESLSAPQNPDFVDETLGLREYIVMLRTGSMATQLAGATNAQPL